jgi:hypothetical protein
MDAQEMVTPEAHPDVHAAADAVSVSQTFCSLPHDLRKLLSFENCGWL